jgi:ligand-binding SRPBCC domain-containing protein
MIDSIANITLVCLGIWHAGEEITNPRELIVGIKICSNNVSTTWLAAFTTNRRKHENYYKDASSDTADDDADGKIVYG